MDQSRVWKTIGDVARATGTKVQTVRYYEELGLLPPAPRSSGNQRLYDDAAQKRLSFIRHARDLGFSLEAVRDLLRLADHPEQPCAEADAIAARQLEAGQPPHRSLEVLKAGVAAHGRELWRRQRGTVPGD